MKHWFSRLTGQGKDSSTTINVSGKKIEVLCSMRANKALTQRERPLVAELELAFACIAHKQVRFHDAPKEGDMIGVNEKLSLLITAIVPNTCEASGANTVARTTARKFVPKWVRIDYAKGEWIGEYGL